MANNPPAPQNVRLARTPPHRGAMFHRRGRSFPEFSRYHQSVNDGIDPHFHMSKRFVHSKIFVQETSRAFHDGNLVYLPSCGSLNTDQMKKTVTNYYNVHEFEPNLDYLNECRQNIVKKHEMVTKLQDAFYAIAMEGFARKFEALHEKYKNILDAPNEQTAREDTEAEASNKDS